jgi:hypothetical protein
LNFAAIGEASGDDVFGNVATGVGGGSIDFGGVFAGEGAAAGSCWVERTTASMATGCLFS